MPKSVAEILKETGLNDEQIAALDAKAIQGFTAVLSTATAAEQAAATAREEAERAQRAQRDLYDGQIAPALDGWATEKANLEAQVAFYRTQNEQARAGGFVPKEAPGYTPPNADPNATRGPDGRYVAGGNPVPGSPKYLTQEEALAAFASTSYVQNEYFRLYKEPFPDNILDVAREAGEQHLDIKAYADRKYKFPEKRSEITAARQKEHDDGIRAETAKAKDKEWAEKVGSNPNVRVAESSRFSNLTAGVKSGEVKDPLSMSREERHRATQGMIQKDIASNQALQ